MSPREADLALRVAPHQRNDDGLLLAALKAVDTVNLQTRGVQLLAEEANLGAVG